VHQLRVTHDASVVDQHVQAAGRLDRPPHRLLRLIRPGDVGPNPGGAGTDIRMLARDPLGGIGGDVGDDHVRALRRRSRHDRLTDSAAAAGHENNLVLEPHRLLPQKVALPILLPPQTAITWPVMKAASALVRKSTTAETSSGRPARRTAVARVVRSAWSGCP